MYHVLCTQCVLCVLCTVCMYQVSWRIGPDFSCGSLGGCKCRSLHRSCNLDPPSAAQNTHCVLQQVLCTGVLDRCSVRCSGLVLCTDVVVPVQTVVVNEGNTPRGQSQEDERTTDVYFSSSERKEETKQCCSFLIRWIQSHMTWIWIVTLPLCSAEHRPLRGRPQYRYTRLQVHHVTKCSYV